MPVFSPSLLTMAAMVARATGQPGRPVGGQAMDWGDILALCRRHHVMGLIAVAAADWPGLPADIAGRIRETSMVAARTSLAQAACLITLCRALETAGLRHLVLKGLPLSILLHGNLTHRRCGDIDLLVSPDDFAAAARLLHTQGFLPVQDQDMPPMDDGSAPDLSALRDLILVRDGILVELHQRLTGNPDRLPLSFDALHAGRRMVALGGQAVPTLGPDHLALYLFVHGASHGWERMAWLSDLATLCRDEAEAVRLIHQVRALGMERAAGQAFALMRELLGSSPPPGLRVPARPGRLTCWLAAGPPGGKEGPVWLARNLCWRWACWRLRSGPVAFWREIAHDLTPAAGRSPLRPLLFLWRHLRPRA